MRWRAFVGFALVFAIGFSTVDARAAGGQRRSARRVESAAERARRIVAHLTPDERSRLRGRVEQRLRSPESPPPGPSDGKTTGSIARIKAPSATDPFVERSAASSLSVVLDSVFGSDASTRFEPTHPDLTHDAPAGEPLRRDEVKTAQRLLQALGFYQGAIDGDIGPRTHDAVRGFDKGSGRQDTGRLDRSILDELLLRGLDVYGSLDQIGQQAVAAHTREVLATVGFSGVGSLRDIVRQYQHFHGLSDTGRLGPELSFQIAADRTLHDELQALHIMELLGAAPDLFLRRPGSLFFALATHGGQRYLLARPDAPELWVLESRTVVRRQKVDAVEAFQHVLRSAAAENSSADLTFVHAAPRTMDRDSAVSVQVGMQVVTVPRAEFDAFVRSAAPLAALDDLISALALDVRTRPRSIAVLDNGLLAQRAGSSSPDTAVALSSIAQAAALKARYGADVNVFLARDARAARENARRVESLAMRGAADLAVYTARTIVDYAVVDNLRKTFARAGIRVADDTPHYGMPAGAGESNVLVITGHRDRAMSDHLTTLKEAGVLKGKLVVVISCYEPGAEAAQSALLSGAQGAAGLLFYDEAINATAVESVMRELSALIRLGGFAPAKFEEWLNRSVERALELAETPGERAELLKLRRPIYQISRRMTARTSHIES